MPFLGTRSFHMLLAGRRKQILFTAVDETTDPRHLQLRNISVKTYES